MDAELVEEAKEKVAAMSKLTLILLVGAVASAGVAVVLHSWIHDVADVLHVIALSLGSLALLRMLNSISLILPSPIARAVHWVHAIVFEVITLICVVVLRLYSYLYSFEKPDGLCNGAPILLVHGYINTASVWVYIKRRLAKAKLGPIYTVNLKNPFGSIREHAETVAQKMNQIQKETGRSDIAIIGHSMGGLVAAYYKTHFASDALSKLITIASPLKGTYMAYFGLGKNSRDMQINSPLILEMQKKYIDIENLYNIGTQTDVLIVPYTSSLWNQDVKRQVVFEDLGHASLLFSPRVAAVLQLFLTNRDFISLDGDLKP